MGLNTSWSYEREMLLFLVIHCFDEVGKGEERLSGSGDATKPKEKGGLPEG